MHSGITALLPACAAFPHQVPADKVPQWSQVRVPEGIQAPGGVANLFGGNVNPLLLLGAVAAIAVPALLFQVRRRPGSISLKAVCLYVR